MRHTIAGILSVVITFDVVTFVFSDRKPVGESIHTSTETIVRSSTEISENNTVSSTATIEPDTEIMSISSDKS